MTQRESTAKWFEERRDQICGSYEQIEIDHAKEHNLVAGKFIKKLGKEREAVVALCLSCMVMFLKKLELIFLLYTDILRGI